MTRKEIEKNLDTPMVAYMKKEMAKDMAAFGKTKTILQYEEQYVNQRIINELERVWEVDNLSSSVDDYLIKRVSELKQ